VEKTTSVLSDLLFLIEFTIFRMTFDTNTGGIPALKNMSYPKTTAKGTGTPTSREAGVINLILAIISKIIIEDWAELCKLRFKEF
jgi:hypothetical protein